MFLFVYLCDSCVCLCACRFPFHINPRRQSRHSLQQHQECLLPAVWRGNGHPSTLPPQGFSCLLYCDQIKLQTKQNKLQTNQNKLLPESVVCIKSVDFCSMPFCLGRRNMLMFSSTQKLVKLPQILANTNTCMIEMISMLNRSEPTPLSKHGPENPTLTSKTMIYLWQLISLVYM